MPAMHYRLRWPDDSESTCYSPSLVIKEYFEPGTSYPLPDFMRRIREASQVASQRVMAKFGFLCSRAGDELAGIEQQAARFAGQPAATVHVIAFQE
jgi:uncharacterized repeat protein (TIGR04042 family)